MKHRWSIFLTALLFAVADAAACVGCREPGQETIAKESPTVMAGVAFSWSVLFMLAFALLVIGSMSYYIGKTCRRIDQERSGQ
jgi:hypothetical protein